MLKEKYYSLLKEKFENKEKVVTEIINLEAILQLPNGTEHFMSDVYGEFDAFDQVLRNGSGSVKEKLANCFEGKAVAIDDLATLIYYPVEKMQLEKVGMTQLEKKSGMEKQSSYLFRQLTFPAKSIHVQKLGSLYRNVLVTS